MFRRLMYGRPYDLMPWQNVVNAIHSKRQTNAQNC
jgi:hypothetical protein